MIYLDSVPSGEMSIEDCRKCIFGNDLIGTPRVTCDLKNANVPYKCCVLDLQTNQLDVGYFVLRDA